MKMVGSKMPMSFFLGDKSSFCSARFATHSPCQAVKCWQLTTDDTVWEADDTAAGLLHADSGDCFSAAGRGAGLERWLQGQSDGAASGAQGIPVLL